jgi:AcrR family transcriptional regulator
MLEAAARLFDAQGYARTTFEQIAAEAGVGVATVYKYFESKQGIVSALLEPDLTAMLARARRIIEAPLPDPARSMVALLYAYRDVGGRNWARREILQLTVFPGMGNEGPLTAFVRKADLMTQSQIAELLKRLRNAGSLNRKLPLQDAAAVIFSLLNQHFGMYLADSSMSFERMFRLLARRVRLLFADWRP